MQLGRRNFLQLISGTALAMAHARAGWAAEEPLRMGSILSVTGPAAFLGEDMKAGLQLAVDEINAAKASTAGRSPGHFTMRKVRRRRPFPRPAA